MKISELPLQLLSLREDFIEQAAVSGWTCMKDIFGGAACAASNPLDLLLDESEDLQRLIDLHNQLYRALRQQSPLPSLSELSVRSQNVLKRADSHDAAVLIASSFEVENLAGIEGCGQRSLSEIKNFIHESRRRLFDYSAIEQELLSPAIIEMLTSEFAVSIEDTERPLLQPAHLTTKLSDPSSPEIFTDLLRTAVESINAKPEHIRVLLARYNLMDTGNFMTLQEIADKATSFGFRKPLTRERVRQVEKKTASKLKQCVAFHDRRLSDFVDLNGAVMTPKNFLTKLGWEYSQSLSNPNGTPANAWRTIAAIFETCGFDAVSAPNRQVLKGTEFISWADSSYFDALELHLPMAAKGFREIGDLAEETGIPRQQLVEIADELQGYSVLKSSGETIIWKDVIPPSRQKEKGNPQTGNNIYTLMRRIFSCVTKMHIEDLSIALTKGRNDEWTAPLECEHVRLIVGHLRDFQETNSQVEYIGEIEPNTATDFDLALCEFVLAKGERLHSKDLYAFLRSKGFNTNSCSVYLNANPLVTMIKSGKYRSEGVRRFNSKKEHIKRHKVLEESVDTASHKVELTNMHLIQDLIPLSHCMSPGEYSVDGNFSLSSDLKLLVSERGIHKVKDLAKLIRLQPGSAITIQQSSGSNLRISINPAM